MPAPGVVCGSAARIVTLMPIAVPELVLAFGFILVFSSDALPWLGSFWLLAAGHLVLTLPYTVTALVADMDQLGLAEYEHAAATLGASFPARMWDVTLPQLHTEPAVLHADSGSAVDR